MPAQDKYARRRTQPNGRMLLVALMLMLVLSAAPGSATSNEHAHVAHLRYSIVELLSAPKMQWTLTAMHTHTTNQGTQETLSTSAITATDISTRAEEHSATIRLPALNIRHGSGRDDDVDEEDEHGDDGLLWSHVLASLSDDAESAALMEAMDCNEMAVARRASSGRGGRSAGRSGGPALEGRCWLQSGAGDLVFSYLVHHDEVPSSVAAAPAVLALEINAKKTLAADVEMDEDGVVEVGEVEMVEHLFSYDREHQQEVELPTIKVARTANKHNDQTKKVRGVVPKTTAALIEAPLKYCITLRFHWHIKSNSSSDGKRVLETELVGLQWCAASAAFVRQALPDEQLLPSIKYGSTSIWKRWLFPAVYAAGLYSLLHLIAMTARRFRPVPAQQDATSSSSAAAPPAVSQTKKKKN